MSKHKRFPRKNLISQIKNLGRKMRGIQKENQRLLMELHKANEKIAELDETVQEFRGASDR